MSNILARLERISRNMVADDVFTIKKPIRFRSEGSTMNALANATMIFNAGYGFVAGTVKYDDNLGGIQEMEAFFRQNDEVVSHTFRGLNFGYGGEGPRGMLEFSKMFGIGLDQRKILDHDYRASLPPKGVFDLVQLLG